jgi:hypothetical protein
MWPAGQRGPVVSAMGTVAEGRTTLLIRTACRRSEAPTAWW